MQSQNQKSFSLRLQLYMDGDVARWMGRVAVHICGDTCDVPRWVRRRRDDVTRYLRHLKWGRGRLTSSYRGQVPPSSAAGVQESNTGSGNLRHTLLKLRKTGSVRETAGKVEGHRQKG